MILYRYKIFSIFNDLELGYQNLDYKNTFPQRKFNTDGTIDYLLIIVQKRMLQKCVGIRHGI